MNPAVEDRLQKLPKSPGVYLMKDAKGQIIYIGKATELRSRVRQYFQGTDQRPFVQLLDKLLHDIDFIVTKSPKEALLLENTLIKKHQPRFNYMMRDDKKYLLIRVDATAAWPKVEIVRQRRKDAAHYFGPYDVAANARTMVQLIHRHFQIRNCSDSMFKSRSRPCLQYQIKRCPAPCVLPVDQDEYHDRVQEVILFLSGQADELVQVLQHRMLKASERMDYETALQIRDQIRAVQNSLAPQHAVQQKQIDTDVIALYREGEAGQIVVASFENGEMNHIDILPVRKQLLDSPTLIAQFIPQYYERSVRKPPREILLSEAIDDPKPLEELLHELRQAPVSILVPQRGQKTALVQFALENAKEHYLQNDDEHERTDDAITSLKQKLRLRQEPRTIECFDISNFQGEEIVAAQVAFLDGSPDKSRYRKYRIQSVQEQDDFASMFEVIRRRAQRAIEQKDPMPDLLVIDGGKGQLNAALQALKDAGIEDQEIISLAESRTQSPNAQGISTHSPERIFLPHLKDPIVLPQNSDMILLLARIRNEAHRFAIEFNRQRLAQKRLHSELDNIPGIGPKRKQALLTHFGSLKKVREASLPELEQCPSLSAQAAWAIFNHFHPGEADPS